MEDTLKQLMEMMSDMKKGQEDMKEDIKEDMKKGQEDIKEDMKKAQEDMKKAQEDMKKGQEDMKKGQEDIRKGQEEMKEDMKKCKEEMKEDMKKCQEEMQDAIREMNENSSKLEVTIRTQLRDFEETMEEEVNQMKTEIGNKFQDVEGKIQVVEDKVQVMEQSVVNKVKEDVKLVQEEMERKIKSLETKFVQALTPGAVKTEGCFTSSTRIKPPTFDGKVPWSTYLKQFEAAATANNWTDEEKVTSLIVALRGEAMEVLRTIPEDKQGNYTAVAAALEMRYGEVHLQHVYQAQLKGRRQRYEETLQQYESDIARMVNLAYPTAPTDFKEQLAVNSFIDGLRDSEISQALRLARHKNIAEALAQALEIEAAKQASRSYQGRTRQVRVTRQNQVFDRKTEDLFKCMKDVLDNFKNQQEQDSSTGYRRRPIRCWNCGTEGHLRNRCPKNTETNQDQENAN